MRNALRFGLIILICISVTGMAQQQPTKKNPAKKQSQSKPILKKVSLEQLGYAMTRQYKDTPWEVSVFGDDETHSLAFDCSDDPHPEDVCFMLYKKYPGADELKILRMVGVKRLYFRAGIFKKSWQKDL